MCGIAGIMSRDGGAPPSAPLLAMGAGLRHRGPDGDGHYRSGDVGLVQTRLAIIDLATGDQPLYEPGGAALIGNGEIYNYVELRAALTGERGVVFSTQSDCELPLHLYRRHGRDFTRTCAACTRWRCTIPAPVGWCWRATRSASSRSITPKPPTASPLPPSRGR